MKHAFAWAISLAFLFPHSTTAGDTKMTIDNEPVLAAIENMMAAFQAGDITSVMKSYEPNAVVTFEPGAPVSDASQLSEMFTMTAALNPKFEYSGHDVIVSGNLALHIAPWKMEGKTPDGQLIEQSGLSVAVLRRQADDSWRLVIDNPHGQRLMHLDK